VLYIEPTSNLIFHECMTFFIMVAICQASRWGRKVSTASTTLCNENLMKGLTVIALLLISEPLGRIQIGIPREENRSMQSH
jgi:hypothetical protein